VSELVSISPLGKIIGTVTSNLLSHSADYKISDDKTTLG
ncbi:VapB-like antitoxin, partial [Sulfolobus sp. C3]